jgi:CubicO group peptidase (beta-lactamase class C family)
MRQLVPTGVVAKGTSPVTALPRAERADIDAVTFQPTGRPGSMTWAQSLTANYTDGILVLHRGRIVYERYFGALAADRQHMSFSVAKSFVATVAAALIVEGDLDEHATVAQYLPELTSSGVSDATVRQLLDMTTGLDYSEDYSDEKSPFWDLLRAVGLMPRPPNYGGADSSYRYVQTLRKSYAHGERLDYKTVNTDVLGWVLRRVTKRSISELLRERLWSALGVEQDGYFIVDATGVEFVGGGLNLTLRDMARFGEMMRLDGRYNGRQIVPKAVVDDIRRGGNREQFAADAAYKTLQGWSYRTMWWVTHNQHGAYMARGIHGQGLYVDPAAEMVIARFASHPLAPNVNLDPTSLPAYDAVARHLMNSSR